MAKSKMKLKAGGRWFHVPTRFCYDRTKDPQYAGGYKAVDEKGKPWEIAWHAFSQHHNPEDQPKALEI